MSRPARAGARRERINRRGSRRRSRRQLMPLLSRAAELMHRYADLGFVDATVLAIAERLKMPSIATTDRRHFTAVQPARRDRFTRVP